MKQLNRKTGCAGEDAAVQELLRKDYRIVERNFSNKFGEIDIIAEKNGVTVFIEVKAKTGVFSGLPEEMISRGKLSKVKRMVSLYTKGHDIPCRIDVIAVVFSDTRQISRLTHYENVYF